MFAAIALSLS